MAVIHFLGTNGWYDTDTGNTVSVLIDAKDRYVILDAGFGFYKIGRYVKEPKPVDLFLSHLHLDHIIGLHTLPLFKFSQGIDFYMPPDSEKDIRTFVGKPFTRPIGEMPTEIRLHDLSRDIPPYAEFKELKHAVKCYGFRLKLDGKTIAFCTDTEDCDGLRALAKDADILITECAFRSSDQTKGSFHLNPEAAATAAKESGAKMLALMHFDPGRYPFLKDRKAGEASARKIFKNTFAAKDGETIAL
jgi:ribonuclease BN (tRNA processing enzyme)